MKSSHKKEMGILYLALCCSPLFSDGHPPKTNEEPYDGDLFYKDKSVFFATAEFLYWIVNEGSVDYAIKMNQPAWSSKEDTFAVGKYQNAHFDWSPGFRISGGHFNAPHYWDVYAQYTFVPVSGSDHAFAPKEEKEFLNGTWAQPDLGLTKHPAPLRKATSHIRLDYNVLDFLFSRRFQTNEHLRLNVFSGITSALFYQKWKVFYVDVLNNNTFIKNQWEFKGIGLRLGAKLDWYMGTPDLYLTGLASNALVSGWYENSAYQKTSAPFPDAENSRPVRNTHFNDTRLTYATQFLAGLSWQKRFDGTRVEALAGYELNIWTNLHQIYRSSFAPATAAKETFINNSNVSLQGLTVRLNIDF